MAGRIITVLLFSPIVLFAGCAGPGDETTETSVTPDKPLIDTLVPAAVETATFALG